MDIDINSKPRPGRADKSVDSKNQAECPIEIPKMYIYVYGYYWLVCNRPIKNSKWQTLFQFFFS